MDNIKTAAVIQLSGQIVRLQERIKELHDQIKAINDGDGYGEYIARYWQRLTSQRPDDMMTRVEWQEAQDTLHEIAALTEYEWLAREDEARRLEWLLCL